LRPNKNGTFSLKLLQHLHKTVC